MWSRDVPLLHPIHSAPPPCPSHFRFSLLAAFPRNGPGFRTSRRFHYSHIYQQQTPYNVHEQLPFTFLVVIFSWELLQYLVYLVLIVFIFFRLINDENDCVDRLTTPVRVFNKHHSTQGRAYFHLSTGFLKALGKGGRDSNFALVTNGNKKWNNGKMPHHIKKILASRISMPSRWVDTWASWSGEKRWTISSSRQSSAAFASYNRQIITGDQQRLTTSWQGCMFWDPRLISLGGNIKRRQRDEKTFQRKRNKKKTTEKLKILREGASSPPGRR